MRWVGELTLVPHFGQEGNKGFLGVLFVHRSPLRKGIAVEAVAHGVGLGL